MPNNYLSFETLNAEEQHAVTQLKQRMKDSMKPEMYSDLSVFVRFLRARCMNVDAAETMLRNHLEWRKMYQVDTIITDYTPKEVLKKYVTLDHIGFDREGCPIVYLRMGGMDSRGLLKSCRKSDMIRFCIRVVEENIVAMKEQSIKLNKTIDKWTMIFDFENFSFSVATHKESLLFLSELLPMYDANYPERLKVIFSLNGSFYFQLAFSVLKHFVPEQTMKKIRFYGNDGWLEALLEVVPEDVLPAFLGGKRTDPDGNPLCKTIINHGGAVDERYFFNKRKHSIATQPNTKNLTVTRLSKIQIPVNVPESGTYLEWEFETKNRDIGFCVLYKENENDACLEELIPKQRIETYMSSETGTIKCEKAGTYVIEFDNSFSWIFRKEIYYRISVVRKQ